MAFVALILNYTGTPTFHGTKLPAPMDIKQLYPNAGIPDDPLWLGVLNQGLFVAKLDADNTNLWVRPLAWVGVQPVIRGVANDAAGNVIVGGEAPLDQPILSNTDSYEIDVVITKLRALSQPRAEASRASTAVLNEIAERR